MKRLRLSIILLSLASAGFTQCPDPSFEITSNTGLICLSQELELTNTSVSADEFAWDFCPENFSESPAVANILVPQLSQGRGFKLVNDGLNWYGFLTSRNNNSLLRLDFGPELGSSFVVSNLGDLSNTLLTPEGLDIVKDDYGDWYGFVGSGSSGKLLRMAFGSSLTNVPITTNLEAAVPGDRFRDMTMVINGGDYVLLATGFSSNKLYRINFGNSPGNAVTSDDVTAHLITGASGLIGLDIARVCDDWYIHTTSFSNNSIQQSYLGPDLFAAPVVEFSGSYDGIVNPFKIKVHNTNNRFFALIANQSSALCVIDLGDLNLSQAPVEIENANFPSLLGIDVLWHKGKTVVLGGSVGAFSLVEFDNACASNTAYSYEDKPTGVKYQSPGIYPVELRALNTNRSSYAHTVTVIDRPAPAIDIQTSGMCVSSPVQFSLTADKQLISVLWDFGDGNISTSLTPTISFGEPGTYDGVVSVTDLDGCMARSNVELDVHAVPEAQFDMPQGFCTNNQILFTTSTPDTYNGNLSYQWLVNNTLVSTDRDLQHTFTSTDPHEIKLITAIPGCADEMTITTPALAVGPVVDFSFSGTCEGDVFSFQPEIDGAVETFHWDFGDNSSENETADWEFSSFGNHPVSLTVTNAAGCENSKTRIVTVHANPIVDFLTTGPPNACAGTPTLFENETVVPDGGEITEWLWHLDDPHHSAPVTVSEPVHVFESSGNYSVRLTAVTDAGCAASAEKEVVIHASPSTAFTYTPACDDVPVSFTPPSDPAIADVYWEIGTSYYNNPSPTHTFRSPGNFPLYLQVTANNGCVSTRHETVHVPVPLAPDFSVSKNCVGQETIFADITSGIDPVIAREWFLTGETFTGSPVNHTFTQQGDRDITLSVSTEAGCRYQVTKQFEVIAPPVAAFFADPDNGAWPLQVSFTNTSSAATDYRWEFLDGSGATSSEESPQYTFGDEGSFNVVLTAFNQSDCEDAASRMITVIAPLPDADIDMITLLPNADGSTKLIVTIHNKGNTTLRDVPLDIDFAGNLSLRQSLDQPVSPGAKHNVVFHTGIISLETLQYLCVTLNVKDDLNPTGNRMCKEFNNQLLLLPSYPNPTASVLHVEWISGSNAPVQISLTDAVGRAIFFAEAPGSIGLNTRPMDLSGLQDGIYYLTIEDESVRRRQRILVFHQP